MHSALTGPVASHAVPAQAPGIRADRAEHSLHSPLSDATAHSLGVPSTEAETRARRGIVSGTAATCLSGLNLVSMNLYS